MTKEKVFSILEDRGINPLKKFGQNFLVDDNITQKIVNSANLELADLVIEIGPGLGALTEYIVEQNENVKVIEIDKGAAEYLEETFDNKISILNQDFLKIDLEDFKEFKNIKIISNLPYYITTPIIEKIITSSLNYDSLTFMMQKEVAERILSSPNSKKYSSLSIFIQYYCNVRKITDVNKNCYHPQPNVDSIVIELTNKNSQKIDLDFFKFVQKCFNSRRKTITNNLSNSFNLSKDEIMTILSDLNIDSKLRPENLGFDEFKEIYDKIKTNN